MPEAKAFSSSACAASALSIDALRNRNQCRKEVISRVMPNWRFGCEFPGGKSLFAGPEHDSSRGGCQKLTARPSFTSNSLYIQADRYVSQTSLRLQHQVLPTAD